jgi:hypothetical protein
LSLTSLLALAAATGAAHWSTPAPLGACASSGAPRVVFPSDMPDQATGVGAVVWPAAPTCAGGEGARVAALGPGEQPGATTIPTTAAGRQIAPRGSLTVAAGPHGEIVIAGTGAGTSARRSAHGLVVEGHAGGAFSQLASIEDPFTPNALATAYLGDVALASPAPAGQSAGGPSVRVERFFSRELVPRVASGVAPHAPDSAGSNAADARPARSHASSAQALETLAVALDYRSDALSVWSQGGALYAHDLPASGAEHAAQRLATVGARPKVAALLSDDNRGILVWAEDVRGQTSVYLDRSDTGVRFGAPVLLERFTDPDGLSSPAGSPSLVRLSSESVMLAWAGAAEGHWVLRTAAIDLRGIGRMETIAARGADVLLDALATGPDSDALALWSEPQPSANGTPDTQAEAIFAARGIDTFGDRTLFGAPEQVAPPGPNSEATVALDPDSDSALAVWRGAGGTLEYAIRGASASAP